MCPRAAKPLRIAARGAIFAGPDLLTIIERRFRHAMNKNEAKTRIAALLSAGMKKADVLTDLSGQGLKDRVLARLIASHPDPERCRKNKVHVWILVALGIAQLAISIALAYLLASAGGGVGATGAAGKVLVGLFVALTVPLSLLFIWGSRRTVSARITRSSRYRCCSCRKSSPISPAIRRPRCRAWQSRSR
jgi:hypothetical protein